MTNREKYKRFLKRILVAAIIFTVIYTYYYVENRLPDKINIVVNEEGCIRLQIPVYGSIYSESSEVVLSGESNINQEEVYITGNDAFYIKGNELGKYEVVYRLFGLIDFKNIAVEVVEEKELLPCGTTVGLYLKTEGVLVIGTAELETVSGEMVSPVKDRILSGDYITAINGHSISGKDELVAAVKESQDQEMILTINRGGSILNVSVSPVKTGVDTYQLGVWVRDDCQGIGTLTYFDQEGNYGALGHAISDTDIGKMVDVAGGVLRSANVHSIIKGTLGTPGSLAGSIGYRSEDVLGSILRNTKQGVFGVLNVASIEDIFDLYQKSNMKAEYLPVGYRHEVKTGRAYIRSSVSGELKDYEIEITNVNYAKGGSNKGITFQVTDKSLLELTGGIVQGMSGSPIIQDGKIIGAVTHVFIQDASKGYGIFIEKMLWETEE